MSREQILAEINGAPPEDRAELYAEYSRIFHQNQSPAPTAEQVQDAHDAEIRLAALMNDVDWVQKYSQGSIAERREAEQLQQMIAAGRDADGLSVRAPIEVVTGEFGIRRRDAIDSISDLAKAGIPPEGIERIMDGRWSDADVEFAQRELDRLKATPAWREALLAADPEARHQLRAWSAVAGSRRIL
jgi:hypothetical protein